MTETEIFIFSGTTEGRELSAYLADCGFLCTVSVATEYGGALMRPDGRVRVLEGRMDAEHMAERLRERAYLCAVDATHPFAVQASGEIRRACEAAGVRCLRLSRDTEDGAERSGAIFFDSCREAAEYLRGTEGAILVTTGSKELKMISETVGAPERLYARVLPSAESLRACGESGLTGRQIYAAQGPFGVEMNVGMLLQSKARYLLTKETGETGGYPEKLEAALRLGVTALVVRNPELRKPGRERLSRGEVLEKIAEWSGNEAVRRGEALSSRREERRKVLYLVGAGVGAPEQRTLAAQRALDEAEVIFGAKRILDSLPDRGRPMLPFYQPEQILAWLEAHPGVRRAAAAYSGDIGFYSGAAGLRRALRESGAEASWEVEPLNGVSSVPYFAARIGESWQDGRFLSLHGRDCNVTGELRKHRKCFLLISDAGQLRELGRELLGAVERGALGELRIYFGYQLSYPEEETGLISLEELSRREKEGLYLLCLVNEAADRAQIVPGIPDKAFLRSVADPKRPDGVRTVPMTKEAVRSLSLCKLRLTRRAVLYDVGGGTGSVSVEAALLCEEGTVYSIERNPAAVALLRKNREQFALGNMEIVEAEAPDGMEALPPPTHLFVGGSGGNLEEIVLSALKKNPAVRAVITCVTLETLSALNSLFRRIGAKDAEILQLSVSGAEKLGAYRLLRGMDPVFVASFGGEAAAWAEEREMEEKA